MAEANNKLINDTSIQVTDSDGILKESVKSDQATELQNSEPSATEPAVK